jgi:hypothetical protein
MRQPFLVRNDGMSAVCNRAGAQTATASEGSQAAAIDTSWDYVEADHDNLHVAQLATPPFPQRRPTRQAVALA